MSKKSTPRPYQQDCLQSLAAARTDGIKRGLVKMASGLGKTMTAAFDIEQFLQQCPNARILVLCHREVILLQNKRKFQQYFGEEFSYGMLTGNEKASRRTDFLFATFQTMCDYREHFAKDAFDYVVVDEAHHSPAPTYRPTIEYFEAQFLLGLTGTPDRMDGQDLLEIYDQTLYTMDVYDGWTQGYLARADYRLMLNDLDERAFKSYLSSDESSNKLSVAQLNKTLFSAKLEEEIAESIREQTAHLENPTMFIFCNSINQAEAMAAHFHEEVDVIHSKRGYQQNQATLDRFYAGELRIIFSIDMLNEGIDVPSANVVVFLRATESLTVFFQQLCRGARIDGGKDVMLVLDYVASIERISRVLEMENTSKQRVEQIQELNPTSAPKHPPITVSIPAVDFQVQRVDIEQLLSNIRRHRRWNKEEVIAGLIEMHRGGQKINHTTIRQNHNLPFPITIKQMFNGSINNALKEGNINQTVREYGKLSREGMIMEGKNMISQGVRITRRSLDRSKDISGSSTIIREFGSVSAFAKLCGQDVFTKEEKREKMLKDYWVESRKAGHWLSTDEVDKMRDKLMSSATYRNSLGGLEIVRRLAAEAYGDI